MTPNWMEIADDGWTVTNYPCTLEFKHKDGRRAAVPKPYREVTIDWWKAEIREAIQRAQ